MATQSQDGPESSKPQSPLREITQPFIDLVHAPRALWGINLAYVIEGMCYFGMLGYLAIYCSEFMFQAIDGADEAAHYMVMMLTAGITIAMFVLGMVADKRGIRFALIAAFVFMLAGRFLWSGAPNLFGLEPVRPGVFAGDKVSLHIEKIETRHGMKTIAHASILASTPDATDVDRDLSVDLAAGEGVAPGKDLESRLVSIGRATVIGGKETLWDIEYGSRPVRARLFAHAAKKLGLCKGAIISLKHAYVCAWRDESKRGADWEYVIRTNWEEDFAAIDKSACESEEAKPGKVEIDEAHLRPKERWALTHLREGTEPPTTVSLSELREMSDGRTRVVLKDVYVTYVRNGGYFLQADRTGPAMFVFVSPTGSALQNVTCLGILLVVIGYGMYQPAAYAGVRKFTTPKTAAMGFAMLYALMNLGGWLPSFAFLLRDDDYLGVGIPGVFWFYTGFTVIALLSTIFILSRKTVAQAEASAKAETARIKAAETPKESSATAPTNDQTTSHANNEPSQRARIRPHMWLIWAGAILFVLFKGESPWYYSWSEAVHGWNNSGFGSIAFSHWFTAALIFVVPVVLGLIPLTRNWIAKHPLQDGKFAYFIFCLIPVQTLFTYNWLVLPPYIKRAFEGWIGDKFEVAANANPILIFIAVPIITALSQRAKVYNMMICGTFVMAAPAFLLAVGPYWWTLFPYIMIMTIGEAMWQPRFLQYAAEIAPEGRTGEYMGVAQLPWFLTKMLVPLLYSGRMMDRFCPAEGPKNTEAMWLIFGCIAMMSTVLLILAKGWLGKDFKTKAD